MKITIGASAIFIDHEIYREGKDTAEEFIEAAEKLLKDRYHALSD